MIAYILFVRNHLTITLGADIIPEMLLSVEDSPSKLQAHINDLLKACRSGSKSFRISAVFDKSEFFIHRYRPCIARNHIKLQLNVSRVPCTLNTYLGQRTTYSESPLFLQHTDTEFGTVCHFVFCPYNVYAGASDSLAIRKCDQFYFIRALCLSF